MSSIISRFTRMFNSGTMHYNPETSAQIIPAGAQKATVAAGCFWGVEYAFREEFRDKGLIDAKVGYTGGRMKNPGYQEVCRGQTGHAEALQVIYNPNQVSYRKLIEFFYRMHDPTTPNMQWPDEGTQYRSAIFFHNEEQEQVAKDVTARAQKEWGHHWGNSKICTQIVPAGEWYEAEDYHQLYAYRKASRYRCGHVPHELPALSSN